MNTQMPKLPTRGAIDLGALAAARKAEAEAAARAASGAPSAVFDATDANFQSLVLQKSRTNPVVVDLWATWCQPCKTLSPILERVTESYAGAVFLAKVDVDANPALSQAFQVQSIPAVFVVLAGQVMPLFQGAVPEPQVKQVFEQVLQIARQQGMPCPTFAEAPASGGAGATSMSGPTGMPGDDAAGADAESPFGAGVAGSVPGDTKADDPYSRAMDAIERADWDGAEAAYTEALKANPADANASAGLALVGLMRRTQGKEPNALLQAAMAAPHDMDAQMLAADALVLNGRPEDGFAVMLAAVKASVGTDRDKVRAHLLELFTVVGDADPAVAPARRALAAALF